MKQVELCLNIPSALRQKLDLENYPHINIKPKWIDFSPSGFSAFFCLTQKYQPCQAAHGMLFALSHHLHLLTPISHLSHPPLEHFILI